MEQPEQPDATLAWLEEQPDAPDPELARVEAAIDRWQRELLDLSRSNRLLYFQVLGGPGPGRRGQGGIAIVQPAPPELFERLANHERRQTIAGSAEPAVPAEPAGAERGESGHEVAHQGCRSTSAVQAEGPPPAAPHRLRRDEILLDGDPSHLDALLYRLRLRARSALLEQGIEILYVGFGLLEWSVPGTAAAADAAAEERILSPLLLLPVHLDRARAVDPYTLTPLDERPILNPALAFQLASSYQLTLSPPEPDDDGDLDYPAALASLRAQLAALPGASVRDGAYLGLFSFAKQAMYADLGATRARLVEHPVVQALAGVPVGLSATLPEPERLDELEHPRDTYQVLDADASQRTVLAAIRRGGSLVVQGPPGTGKSQTIANAIAEALARGKKVLFVSEKLAALQVVARRLRAAGLGDYCLEVHGHGGDKAAIVRELAAALPEVAHHPASPRIDDLGVLAQRRAALNTYPRALHDADNPLGASAFAIHGELARRAGAPRVPFNIPSIATLTRERAVRMIDLVRRLVPLAEVVTAPEQHPWFGCTLPRWTPQEQARLEVLLDRLARAADELAEVQARAAARWSLAFEPSLAGARWLLGVLSLLDGHPPIVAGWLGRPTTTDLSDRARAWSSRHEAYAERRQRLLARHTTAIFDRDLPTLVEILEQVDVDAADRLHGDGPAADRALATRAVVEHSADRVLRAVSAVLSAAGDLAAQLGIAAPATRAEAAPVLQVADLIRANPRPEPGWLAPGRLGQLSDLVTEAARHYARAAACRQELAGIFNESVLTAITPELARRFETIYTSWTRQLRPSWYDDIGLLQCHLRADRVAAGLDYPTAAAAIGRWRELVATETWLATQATTLSEAFGRHYFGGRTDWVGLQRSIDLVRRLTEMLGDLSRWPLVMALLLGPGGPAALDQPADLLRAALAELDAALAGLSALADVPAHPARAGARLPELAADLERWLGALTPLWAAAEALHRSRREATISAADLLAEARDALACQTLERELGAATPELADELGPFFQGLATDWPRLLEALAWTDRLRAAFDGPPPAAFIHILDAEAAGPLPERAELEQAVARLRELREELGGSFGVHAGERGPRVGSQPIDRATLPALAGWARARRADLPRVQEWIDGQALLAELASAGLGGFVDGLIREAPPADLWVDAFLRQLFTLWLSWRYERAPALARFRRQDHEAAIAEFGRLDRRQWDLASQRIEAGLLAKRPGRTGVGMNSSEISVLLREARKQRRFKPLRRLFAELPLLLPKLKPCLMMSPLSVAQHLGDSAITFDLVIFDEASQILPADAIGAIGRGKQVVVVGDRRQLPPTRFFQVTTLDTLADEADDEPPESVLDACLNAGLPESSLLWHYRSRHEHLIAFSNGAFYDGRLRTFPSPDADRRVVTFVHVPSGVYDRGGTRANRAEAMAVADLVVEHVERQAQAPANRRLSLGVIAFSEAQMLAILGELEARKRARPELEPLLAEEGEEGLFVKNLESVQGDERDVILFSIGYGRDADGRLTMGFGPLNAPGGERRLNVAVTRARRRVTVVASIRAHEIDGSPERPAGVRALKRYLEYAERGPSALPGAPAASGEPAAGGSRLGGPGGPSFEEAVRAALQAALDTAFKGEGLQAVARVGVGGQPVDLAVRDTDGRYLLAIECDGQRFAQLPTARDRDRLRREMLERLGWQVHRIWSPEWISAQQQETELALAAVERARRIRDGLLVDDAPLPVLKPEDRSVQGPSRPTARLSPPDARTTELSNGPRPASLTATTPQASQPAAASMPPTPQPPAVSMSPTPRPPSTPPWGPSIPTAPHAGEGELSTPAGELVGEMKLGPNGSSRAELARPVEGEVAPERSIDQVAPAEIGAAVRAVLARELALPSDDLVLATARELGYERTGVRIRAAIGRVTRQLLQDGVLQDVGGHLGLANS
jgi:very-short-patch-repair endonuclease